MIEKYKKNYNTLVGFSDHSVGSLPAAVAVSFGANMIEKHIQLGKSKKNVDNFFSTEVNEFKKMVDTIRNTEKILGSINFKIPDKAKVSLNGKRSIYVVQNIKKGEKFTKKNIKVIRPVFGLDPKYYDKVLGKRTNVNLNIGDKLRKKNIN